MWGSCLSPAVFFGYETYGFPDCFYLSSSLRQLKLVDFDMLPGCTVSWNFLRRLTLSSCSLYDESIANILSGSPNLETLQLFYCGGLLKRLDLMDVSSRRCYPLHWLEQILSLAMLCGVRLPKLKVQSLTFQTNFARSVIPSIARLLQNSPGLKKLEVHATYVSYITDADLDEYLRISQGLDSDTCWRSKHEVFPTTSRMYSMSDCNDAKMKLLDSFLRLVLRNAKRLEKIVVWLGDSYFSDEQMERLLMDADLDEYLRISQGLDSDTCWRSKHEVFPTTSRMYSMSDCNDAKMKLLDSFLRLVLRNAKRLEKIVVWLGDSYFSDEQRERLLMVGTLSPNNNVSIEFK
ncbi:hypothetical protein DY000_02020618 [Brassica cretica]|uniref:F-box/LRR-repeat protein 15/At3g58940/PEG3-like LRR domain-containing protein n=1 Tax=Brassica cretica TaxID=69181 RepID=A0ABQ7E5Q7_BRACR|nr:hypothetical protein DY000_02020618 [Brassica cretica]